MPVTELTKENFNKEVTESEKTVLIDFWAEWCAPCLMMSPVIDKISEEHTDYKICKINVDKEPELSQSFGIMSIPTFLIFKEGKQFGKLIGVQSKEAILDILK